MPQNYRIAIAIAKAKAKKISEPKKVLTKIQIPTKNQFEKSPFTYKNKN